MNDWLHADGSPMATSLKMHAINVPASAPEPAWDVARLFPDQGAWSEQEYLELNGNRLVEFSNGCIEVLAMPTQWHQLIVACLYGALLTFSRGSSVGLALFAPLSVRLWAGKFRQPDLVFMLAEHSARRHNEFWEGADLVMEVVSDDDRRRDIETKRFEYAQAAIPEYWIVDPRDRRMTVLKLVNSGYEIHGIFSAGEDASSALLPGFSVDVTTVFAAAP